MPAMAASHQVHKYYMLTQRCLQGDKASAKELIVRTVHLGLFIGTCLAAALLVMRGLLPSIFTSDAAVRTMVASFLPIIAFYMVSALQDLLGGRLADVSSCRASCLWPERGPANAHNA